MDGIFIPNEIAKLNTLNWTEKVLLSIYWYRSNGKLKCCKMRNEDIYKELMLSKNTFHRMKTHLKELGYIRTDGGIRVYYLGVGIDIEETETVDEVDEVDEQVNETEITENEKVIEQVDETDNKIDNKTDIVMEKSKTNIEKVIESLDPFYKDPKKLKYFYEKCKLWVEHMDNLTPDEFNYSMAVTGIKSVINEKFDYPEVAAIPNKKKEVKSEFDGCFM